MSTTTEFMMGYDWNFASLLPYLTAFRRGLIVTFQLSAISSIVGTIIGFLCGWLLRAPLIGSLLVLINDCIRAIPMLVLMFGFYYFPYESFGFPVLSAFCCAAAALTLAQVAFTADVVRGAIDGVSKRSLMAARSLGLKESTILMHITVPDVARQILPTLVAFVIGNIKLSSLAAVIACEEIVFVARLAVSQTFRSLEAWVVVAALYILMVVPLSLVARRLEQSTWLTRRS